MVKHDYGLAAGTKHAMNLAYGCGSVGRVMKHAVRVDDVKRVVGEIQRFGVRNAESARQVKQFEAPLCQVNGSVSEIDSRVFGAGFGKLSAVSSEATTHFQHAEVLRVRKPGSRRNVPLLFITMLFDELIKPARARGRIGKLGPTGILLPERPHAIFQYGVALRHLEHRKNNSHRTCSTKIGLDSR